MTEKKYPPALVDEKTHNAPQAIMAATAKTTIDEEWDCSIWTLVPESGGGYIRTPCPYEAFFTCLQREVRELKERVTKAENLRSVADTKQ